MSCLSQRIPAHGHTFLGLDGRTLLFLILTAPGKRGDYRLFDGLLLLIAGIVFADCCCHAG